MMKETNIQPQVTSTIAGDDGEAVGKVKKTLRKWLPKSLMKGLKTWWCRMARLQEGRIWCRASSCWKAQKKQAYHGLNQREVWAICKVELQGLGCVDEESSQIYKDRMVGNADRFTGWQPWVVQQLSRTNDETYQDESEKLSEHRQRGFCAWFCLYVFNHRKL